MHGAYLMKVISYLNVIPPTNTNQEKIDILNKYITGVKQSGDQGILYNGYKLHECDVAVIQGWQHELGKAAAHLKLRKSIIDFQLERKKFVCVADSNLFLYANATNFPHHYLRYSFNGVFPNSGIYCDTHVNSVRWDQISKDLNITLEKKKTDGSHILICLQRNGGWSMGNDNVINWTINIVNLIRNFSERPIVIRTHPGDKSASKYIPELQKIKSTKVSKIGTPLEKDLKNAWCVVNHNSSSIVGPIILGYSAFITDPAKSQCKEVSDTDFSKIETPADFDREQWVKRISMFHWKFDELENGSCWKHMKNYCQ